MLVKVYKNDIVEIDGVSKTVGEWCKEYRRSVLTVQRRVVGKGMNIVDAITTKRLPKNNYFRLAVYTVDGVTKTLEEWCEEYKITAEIVLMRFEVGWALKDALTIPVRNLKNLITAIHDGEEKSLTIPGWAEILKCDPSAIKARISILGWTPEKAVTTPTMPRRMITAMHDGELKTLHIKEWAKLLGISRIAIEKRVSRDGMTYEEAVSRPRDERKGKIITAEHDGEMKSLTKKEWAELLGSTPETIHHRICSLGWSDEKAVTTPVVKRAKRHKTDKFGED